MGRGAFCDAICLSECVCFFLSLQQCRMMGAPVLRHCRCSMTGKGDRLASHPYGSPPGREHASDYSLDDNIGFLLRVCNQRSVALFSQKAPEGLSAPRFAALAKLMEAGPLPQNRLGRLISIDAATIKGVVDRLQKIGAVRTDPNPADRRQRIVSITEEGESLYRQGVAASRYTVRHLCEELDEEETAAFALFLSKAAHGDPRQ